MRTHRARRSQPTLAAPSGPTRATIRVYECPRCQERYVGERRCPECNLFCRSLGPGGECPCCCEPIAISDLIGPRA